MKVFVQSSKRYLPCNYNFFNAYQGFYEMGFETVFFHTYEELKTSNKEVENKKLNSRTSYLKRLSKKIGDEWNTEKTNKFLLLVWQKIFKNHLVTEDNTGYSMDVSAFKVHSIFSENKKRFQCERCGRITVHNADGICPTYRCEGKLTEFDDSIYEQNHYYKLYNHLDIYDLKIKEHTAQLSVDRA